MQERDERDVGSWAVHGEHDGGVGGPAELVHHRRRGAEQRVSIVQDLGENPQPRPDGVGGVRVDAGELAVDQALQDPVHGAPAQADGVGQLPHTPTPVAVPGGQGVEDSNDPVVPGDHSRGILTLTRSSSSPRARQCNPCCSGAERSRTRDRQRKYRDSVSKHP